MPVPVFGKVEVSEAPRDIGVPVFSLDGLVSLPSLVAIQELVSMGVLMVLQHLLPFMPEECTGT